MKYQEGQLKNKEYKPKAKFPEIKTFKEIPLQKGPNPKRMGIIKSLMENKSK